MNSEQNNIDTSDKISIASFLELYNPWKRTIWMKVDHPITKDEISEAINKNTLLSPNEPKTFFMGIWDESSKEEHIQRIAWFVVNFSHNFPIKIDFGLEEFTSSEIVCDGNHRLMAVAYRNEPFINAHWCGSVDIFKKFKFVD